MKQNSVTETFAEIHVCTMKILRLLSIYSSHAIKVRVQVNYFWTIKCTKSNHACFFT